MTGKRYRPIIERFEEKFEVDPITNCWNWIAGKHNRGYGHFHIFGMKKKSQFAHRVSLHIYRDFDLSSPLSVCHKCDNTSCVNPDHLFIGSHKDNMRDMVNKKRNKPGSQKLTDKDYELAKFLRSLGVQIKEIARLLQIDAGHASRISR